MSIYNLLVDTKPERVNIMLIFQIPELNAEKMTLTGLNLFQKLFGLTRLSNASPINQQSESQSEEVS